jgi:hypothetical protein
MSRAALAAELADFIRTEVATALTETLAHLDKCSVNISDLDDQNAAHILGALTSLSELAGRIASPEVRALLDRAAAGRQ